MKIKCPGCGHVGRVEPGSILPAVVRPRQFHPGQRFSICHACGHIFVRFLAGGARHMNVEEKAHLLAMPKETVAAVRAHQAGIVRHLVG